MDCRRKHCRDKKRPAVSVKMTPQCTMENQTKKEKAMTIEEKRVFYHCNKHKLSCNNCPLYNTSKK